MGGRKWTKFEDDYLRTNYALIRPREMTKTLNRTCSSIWNHASLLGLQDAKYTKKWFKKLRRPVSAQPFPGIVTPFDIGYVAGVIDGEGTIYTSKKGGQVQIRVPNTCESLIDRLLLICGGTKTGPYLNRSGYNREHCLPTYYWQINSGESAYRLLVTVSPHLTVKAPEAEIALNFLRTLYGKVEMHGQSRPGEANGNHKLTDAEVGEIRRVQLMEHPSQEELAKRFGVTQANVSAILRGAAWKNVLPLHGTNLIA